MTAIASLLHTHQTEQFRKTRLERVPKPDLCALFSLMSQVADSGYT